MTIATHPSTVWAAEQGTVAPAAGRDSAIDTMRGIAILMVIGIHSLPPPSGPGWEIWIDAALRPCVPIFLFASAEKYSFPFAITRFLVRVVFGTAGPT